MPVFLPRKLAALAKLCADDSGRYATACVQLTTREDVVGDGAFRCDVTDLKRLLVVQGTGADTQREEARRLSVCDLLRADGTPERHESCRIQKKDWKEMLELGDRKEYAHVGVLTSANHVVAACGQSVGRYRTVDQRYPDIQTVLPRRGAVATCVVDAAALAGLLSVCAALLADRRKQAAQEIPRVELLFYGDGLPLGIRADGPDVLLDGLIMPLTR